MQQQWKKSLQEIQYTSCSNWFQGEIGGLIADIEEWNNLKDDILFEKWSHKTGLLEQKEKLVKKRADDFLSLDYRHAPSRSLKEAWFDKVNNSIEQKEKVLRQKDPNFSSQQIEQNSAILEEQKRRLKRYRQILASNPENDERVLLAYYLKEIAGIVKDIKV